MPAGLMACVGAAGFGLTAWQASSLLPFVLWQAVPTVPVHCTVCSFCSDVVPSVRVTFKNPLQRPEDDPNNIPIAPRGPGARAEAPARQRSR